MGQRGRPPHPDILTPRQWEVLDLLREGLSDQQIADRLGVTLAGAKYHVSEILTKLGVASREDAAAWQPPEPARLWWQRALALSLAWKAAGVAVLVATAVGIGVLAWGVASTGETRESVFEDLHLPTPATPPLHTPEEILASVHPPGGGGLATDIQVTTFEGIHATRLFTDDISHNSDVAWLIRRRYVGLDCMGSCGPVGRTVTVACRDVTILAADDPSPSGPGSETEAFFTDLPDAACDALSTPSPIGG